MGWTFYNSNGQRLSSAATNIAVLDIDGATDIGAAIVDADLFIIDDGAGGTNRKTAASRIKTYAGVTQANQAALEAETDEDTYAAPDMIKYSPGVAKAWVYTLTVGGAPQLTANYNVSSLGDDGTGHVQVNWDTDFSGASTYCVVATSVGNASNMRICVADQSSSASAVDVFISTHDGTATDADIGVAAFGDQ